MYKQILDCSSFTLRVAAILLLIALGAFSAANASHLDPGARYAVASDNTVFNITSYPVHVVDASGASITDVQEVASGDYHAVALKLDGTLLAWGGNNWGQLGDGTTGSFSDPPRPAAPVLAEADTPFTGVQAIAVGAGFTIALKTDGSIWAWGANFNGSLGDGTTTNHSYPAPVVDETGNPITEIVKVYAGTSHVFALKSDGTMLAWGNNSYGQLGDGTTSNRLNPVAAVDETGTPVTGVQSIAAGLYHSLALKSDGSLLAWGYNTYGQLGDGTTTNRYNPVPVLDKVGIPITGIQGITAGWGHSIALKTDSTMLAWGYNYRGQIGDGTYGAGADRLTPVTVVDETGDPISCIIEVAADRTSIAMTSYGTLLKWGSDYTYNPELVKKYAMDEIVEVEAGGSSTFARKFDGTLLAWGRNNQGQLGDGTTTQRNMPVFVVDTSGNPVEGIQSVSAGTFHSLALKTNGTILAWGSNSEGELGDGTTTGRHNPVQVLDGNGDPIIDVEAVSAGYGFSLALKTDGTVLAWGDNDRGQLGIGSFVSQSTPVPVVDVLGNPISDIQAVSAGGSHALALKTDGTILAWGSNIWGQLGDGTAGDPEDGVYVPRYKPVQVVDASSNPITGVQAVSAGGQHSNALKTNGTVLSWGSNNSGILGIGTSTAKYNPVTVVDETVNPITEIVKVDAGTSHVFALKSDGTMLAWGNNYYGQLGNNGGDAPSGIPVAVQRSTIEGDIAVFLDMAVGGIHSIGLMIDDIRSFKGATAWGRNDNGQLGLGLYSPNTNYLYPVIVDYSDYWFGPDGLFSSHLYRTLYLSEGSEGSVLFTVDTGSVVEGDGSISLSVSRTCGSNGTASVNYATTNGTATSGEDYTSQSGTLEWIDGDAVDKQITIAIADDSSTEGDETFIVNLTNAAGASLGTPDTATVTINDRTIVDTDGDGVEDDLDAFPTDPAASIDTDNDGYPDSWNDGKTEADSTSGLTLDAFSTDPAASLDSDNDGYPDSWNDGKTEADSTSGLTLDVFPSDDNEWSDQDLDGVGDNSDNCPDAFNDDQADTDTDTIGDVCDNCPDAFNDDQTDSDTDTIGDVCDNCPDSGNSDQSDVDYDAVGDVCDNCPIDYNPFQADADSDGFGNTCDDGDYDGDGFTDAEEVLCESDPADASSMCSQGMPWLFLLLEE